MPSSVPRGGAGLGFAYKEEGDAPAARRSVEKALEIDPRSARRLREEIEP